MIVELIKIEAILGSPRKRGNSATLAQAFLDEAAQRGAEMEVYALNKLKNLSVNSYYFSPANDDRYQVQ